MMMLKIIICTTVVVRNLNVILALISEEDTLYKGVEADRYNWTRHPCNRPCVEGGAAMTCEYLFVIETYMSMPKACFDCPRNLTDCYRPHCIPVDGEQRIIYVANRLLPGPHIQVCEGDTIVVDVRNAMQGSGTTIHWHGLRQKESPYMDGVPHLTQCPISPMNTFRYMILASQSGTYFWHSHIGGQRVDGLFGGLTIRNVPSKNPHRHLYDFDEHSMSIIDWKSANEEDFVATVIYIADLKKVRTILINGYGRYKNFAIEGENSIYTPDAVFTVKQGYKYRFRFFNAGADNCPIQVSVDNHTLTVISADANDIEPVEVDTIYTWPGERYDFIINANQKIENYWIRYRGYQGICKHAGHNDEINQVAILRYELAPIEDPKGPYGWDIYGLPAKPVELNPYFLNETSNKKVVRISSLKAIAPNDESTREEADQQIYITNNLEEMDNYDYHRSGLYGIEEVKKSHPIGWMITHQFNHITFKMPSIPLLPQRHMITPNMTCNATTMVDKDCKKNYCICPHTLHVKLKSLVELVIVDENVLTISEQHPLHLHGHFFRVVAEGLLEGKPSVERVKQLDQEGKIKRNFDHPPIKDTNRLNKNGYLIIRFYADNPGYWFFHCHFEEHVEVGLGLIIKVGEHEDMLPVPKNFPQCGHYQPNRMNIIYPNNLLILNFFMILICLQVFK